MNDDTSGDDFVASTRILQIIVVAMVLGVVCFAMVVLFLNGIDRKAAQTFGILTLAALAMTGGALVMHRVLFGILHKQLCVTLARREKTDDEALTRELAVGLQTRTIVAAAFCEGAAFFNLVAFMQERNPYCLIATGLFVAAMLSFFPTAGSYAETIERDRRRVAEERSLR